MSGEQALRRNAGSLVSGSEQVELLARTPPCCILDLLHHGRHWGLSRWEPLLPPLLRDCAASDPAWRLPMKQSRPTPHVPQPLLHCVRRHVPAWHFTDSDVALLTEQARGGVRQVL